MKLKEALISLFSSRGKELKTVWKVEKDGKTGFLAGTAHFFPYRLKDSLRSYIQNTKVVLFEGPLDENGLNQVIEKGAGGGNATAIYEALDVPTVKKIKRYTGRLFEGPGSFPSILPFLSRRQDPVYAHFQTFRPWMAFFHLWSHFLKERGWKYSVDLEALEIATQRGKEIIFLETIEEQIAGLEGIPLERFINFFKRIDQWEELANANVKLYLGGKLEALLDGTNDFPSRCPSIVEKRDPVMFERMKKFFEKGEVIAFVGTPHIPGISARFKSEGFAVRQVVKGEE